jgi:TonB family protein
VSRIIAASLVLSMLTLSTAAKASAPADGATNPTPVRVSSGAVPPALLGAPVLYLPDSTLIDLLPEGAQVGLSLTVNKKGQAENIRVIKTFDPFVDNRLVEAVNQMHFRPATIDGQPTAADMNLEFTVAR